MMRRGPALLALLVLLLSGAGPPTSAAPQDNQLLVDQDGLEVDEGAIVHAVVQAPQGTPGERIDVRLTVEGPDRAEQIQRSAQLSGGSPQLVTLTWTPDEPGTHHLDADVRVGSQLVDVAERNVYVSPQDQEEDRALVERAPGSVQWAIVGAGVYLVLRAGSRDE